MSISRPFYGENAENQEMQTTKTNREKTGLVVEKNDSFIWKLFKAENECNEADKINSTYDFQEHCWKFIRFLKREITEETNC